MCYQNTLKKPPKDIAGYFAAEIEEGFSGNVFHANGFTFPDWPVLDMQQPGKLQIMQWGLIPSWVKDVDEAKKMRAFNLNARSETVFEKASFRQGIQTARCLVPSTGFIEWREFGKKKYPYYITLKDRDLFSMAGLSERWVRVDTGEVAHTFTILTTGANEVMKMIHNTKQRMPVLLRREDEKHWLDPGLTEEDIRRLCLPFLEDDMQYHTIGPLVSSRTEPSNVPKVLQPWTYPELQSPPPTLF